MYGVATDGGTKGCFGRGCGVVYELSPLSGGGWKQTVIHAFTGGFSDTSTPVTNLVFDAQGNPFRATSNGTFGAVYELSPSTGGGWTERVIYPFTGAANEAQPSLAFDSQGSLYISVLATAGAPGGGVLQLSQQSGGTWTATLIHLFNGTNGDGLHPYGGVIVDAKGSVFGTTQAGGSSNDGIVYELSPKSDGTFTKKILFTFTGPSTGTNPLSALTLDSKGDLFGTTSEGGGVNQCCGVIFELTQRAARGAKTLSTTSVSPPTVSTRRRLSWTPPAISMEPLFTERPAATLPAAARFTSLPRKPAVLGSKRSCTTSRVPTTVRNRSHLYFSTPKLETFTALPATADRATATAPFSPSIRKIVVQ